MYKKGGMMKLPPSTASIWRFTDLTKLLAILENNALWFSSVKELDDPYEAYIRVPTFEEWRDLKIYARVFAKTENYTEDDIRGTWECYVNWDKMNLNGLFVNCWHRNDYESAAMWKLYISHAEGVAIRSTVGRLIAALQLAPQKILLGEVDYIDYERKQVPNNVFCRSIVKRKSFEHEREIRAVYYDETIGCDEDKIDQRLQGVHIPVNVDILIDSIYVAPTSPAWTRDLVEAVITRYGLRDIVKCCGRRISSGRLGR